jgi:hypothetical protein
MTCSSMPMPTASKDRLLLSTEASSHRYRDSTILRSTCSSQNPQTSAAQSPPGQMLGGSATGTTTKGRVGLDHHNLASQSVFEPSFDLTVASKSFSTRCALKHLLVTGPSSDCTSIQGHLVYRYVQGLRDVCSMNSIIAAGCPKCVPLSLKPECRARIGVVRVLSQ